MARTHARVKGKSGSTRPVKTDLSFVTLKAKEVEDLVVKMAKDDVKPSKIGLVLRDSYGVPSIKKLTGKSVTKILSDSKLLTKVPEDLQALVTKLLALKKHLQNNPRDTHNKRGYILAKEILFPFSSI